MPSVSRDVTFAELRTIKGKPRVQSPGEAARTPYARERLVDGEQVTLEAGALAWMRRDAGATWLVAGPAEFTLHENDVELKLGRVFVDNEFGGAVEVLTPRGKLELSEARASIDIGKDGAMSVYVLRGSARATGNERASAGELLTWQSDGTVRREASRAWDDWTGGLATAEPAAEPAPFGLGTVGARKPGDGGQPRFPLVIQRLDVKVRVDRDFAVTEVDETFVNPSSDVVEGLYSFRTPPSSVLSRFGVDRQGSVVWGRIQESRSAAKQYASNVYAGSEEEPALLQWAGGGTYNARLYPIRPGQSRRVVTRYTEWLSRQGPHGERRLYVYPMAAEGARASLPRIEELRFTLDLSSAGALRVRSGLQGKREGSQVVVKAYDFVPRADLAVELFDNGQAQAVAYRAPHRLEREDVVEGAQPDFASVVAREEPDYVALPLRAFGHTEEAAPGIDLGIVVDTSAATESSALALARSMTASLLAQLGPQDHAALWAGDATLRAVAPGSDVPGTLDAEKRRTYLAGLAAIERGGATDLGALLTEAASKLDPKRRGAIVYIGDGLPSVGELAPKSLRERLARLGPEVRVLAAAIGTQPNLALLEGLVRGAPVERVGDAYGAAQAALRLLEAASKPLWIGAQVDFGSGVERLLPRELPPISGDESVIVVGRISGKVPTSLTLRGERGQVTRPLVLQSLGDLGDLRRRWGEGRLAELTAEGVGRASLVEVARRFGLVSPFTSLYVPTEREQSSPELASTTSPLTPSSAKRRRWKPWSNTREESVSSVTAALAPAAQRKEGGTGQRELAKAEPAAPPAPAASRPSEAQEFGMVAGATGGRGLEPPMDASASRFANALRDAPAEEQRSKASAMVAPLTMPSPAHARLAGAKKPTSSAGASLGVVGAAARPMAEAPSPRVGPKGNVTLSDTQVQGGSIGNAARVVAGMRAGLRACYNRGLAEDPDSAGTIRLTLFVASRGAVLKADVNLTGDVPISSLSCIRSRAMAAQFEPVAEGVPVRVLVTATLTSDHAASAPEPRRDPLAAEPKPSKALATSVTPNGGFEPIGVVRHQVRPCGAGANLPLAERRILWRERLSSVRSASMALTIYRGALEACEATHWDERALLLVSIVDRLSGITDRVELWRALLKVSPAAADAVYRFMLLRVQTAEDLKQLHDALGLQRIEPTLLAALLKKASTPVERLTLLRGAADRFPDDTELALLVLDAYEDARDDGGGRAFARTLRRRVDATAHVRTQVGEYYLRLAAREQNAFSARDAEEARRTFGELVEFAPEDPLARRRLGDLLRAHGWFEEAARQYETLGELTPDDASVQLLRALAANGMGRVEEAVRWTEKAASTGAEDGTSPLALAARAQASTFLSWARIAAASAGRSADVERLRTRAARLSSREGSHVRFTLTWAHPELRPALWTVTSGSAAPAPDNLPLYGIAQAFVADPALVEVRLDPEDAANAARLDTRAILTAVRGEGTPEERIARAEVSFRDQDGKPLFRVEAGFENDVLVVRAPTRKEAP